MKLLFGLLLVSVALSDQIVPIPSPFDGFYQGPYRSNYTLEVFIDFLDPASAANYPAVTSYWTANQKWLELVIHQFPMPYNLFSFTVAQAGRYIQQSYKSQYLNFINYWFTHQTTFTSQIGSLDFQTAQTKIAQLSSQATGVPLNNIFSALNNQTINHSTRVSWKYAASRNIPGVPSYLVNGVWVPDAYNFTTVADWTNFFNSLA